MADHEKWNQNQNENRNPQQEWRPDPNFQNGPSDEYHNPYNPYERGHRPKDPQKEKNSYATAALIGGILAVINLCCFAFTTSIIFGVGAISFAFVSKKDQKLSTPAKVAIFLGAGSIVFGAAEYFLAIKLYEYIKLPENIPMFNQMFEEAERMLESQAALQKVLKH